MIFKNFGLDHDLYGFRQKVNKISKMQLGWMNFKRCHSVTFVYAYVIHTSAYVIFKLKGVVAWSDDLFLG